MREPSLCSWYLNGGRRDVTSGLLGAARVLRLHATTQLHGTLNPLTPPGNARRAPLPERTSHIQKMERYRCASHTGDGTTVSHAPVREDGPALSLPPCLEFRGNVARAKELYRLPWSRLYQGGFRAGQADPGEMVGMRLPPPGTGPRPGRLPWETPAVMSRPPDTPPGIAPEGVGGA